MDAATLLQKINRPEDALPVILLVGPEKLLIERVVSRVRGLLVDPELQGFSEEIFFANQVNASSVVQASRTVPMMVAARVVIVRGIEAWKATELDALCDYLGSPSPTTVLLLSAQKLDGRSRFAKVAKKQGVWIDAQTPKGQSLNRFVIQEAKRLGHSLSSSVAATLVDAVGSDLSLLADTVERLSLFVGEGQEITLQSVETSVMRVRVDSVWTLVDAVGECDTKTALEATASLLADREAPLKILALVARQFRLLAKMQGALSGGVNAQGAAKTAGVPPFKAQAFATAARKFSDSQLRSIFSTLADTDLQLKGNYCPAELVLERTVLELCASRNAGNRKRDRKPRRPDPRTRLASA